MLEVMVTCLHRYAALLKEPQNGTGIFFFNPILSLICNELNNANYAPPPMELQNGTGTFLLNLKKPVGTSTGLGNLF